MGREGLHYTNTLVHLTICARNSLDGFRQGQGPPHLKIAWSSNLKVRFFFFLSGLRQLCEPHCQPYHTHDRVGRPQLHDLPGATKVHDIE